ncbi:MAG TPA: SDR family oxidoreductase [Flexivirga sp.]|uniref:SDR family oxidoreductase n=1 Tax=Flexivirga sp. TaxID=1962927 RepID=UPI002CA71BB8|nr:SDR family oxidoreductase [Flexivirga sp.]HWC24105.1 SDR family oxidoreductase [Flexivirga sp.]
MTDKPVALVSGANAGIGFEVARGLTTHGFTVLVGSRDAARGAESAARIGNDAHPVQLDVTDEASITAAADRMRTDFGRLDVLVNNAGVSFVGDPSTPLQERGAMGLLTVVPLETVREIFETNVFGVIALTQAMLPLLRKSPEARIVNVGSSGGSLTLNSDPANPHRAMFGVYPTSKAALHAVTVGFAATLESEGIRVNAADPGFTSTALNNFQGTKSVEDGARRIVELALLGPDGPSGTFSSDEGPVPW